MTQANTNNSTLDSSRRRFLAITAAASAVSATALAAAAMPVRQACALPPADPIFAAIKRHQEAAYGCAEDEARWELGTAEPTTLAGLLALLEYADASDVFGEDDLANIVGGARACLARHLG